MNESDKFRSKVECKWLIDLAQKLKTNKDYKTEPPYSIPKHINNFTSIYIPDIILTEKGISNRKKDARDGLESKTPNRILCDELQTLKSLRPARSPNKLAIVGENIHSLMTKRTFDYKGSIPSIHVECEPDCEETDSYDLICVRINNCIIKSVSNSCKCQTVNLDPKLTSTVDVNEDSWDAICVENCGEISFHYKWTRENCCDKIRLYFKRTASWVFLL